MRESIDLELELLTPAFLSGADQKAVEVRAASVRGLLRWWWRALVGHTCDLATLRAREAALFGSAEEKRKSPVVVAIAEADWKEIPRGTPAPRSGRTYRYSRGRSGGGTQDLLPYLGYGPVRLLTRAEREHPEPVFRDAQGAKRPLFIRPALDAGSRFVVRASWRPGALSGGQIEELVRAAASWAALGGIGARSRKGWGALAGKVRGASSASLGDDAEAWWRAQAEEVLRNGEPIPDRLPDFPQLAFRRVYIEDLRSGGDWKAALGAIGERYRAVAPKEKGLRWIRGVATPRRRASSLLVSLARRKDGRLAGLLCLLPCRPEQGRVDGTALRELAERLANPRAS